MGRESTWRGGAELMTIFPPESSAPRRGPAEWFTGEVSLREWDARPGVKVVQVTFQPRARTAWHTHPRGQLLVILAGRARVQAAGGPVHEAGPGERIWFEPGERHWHGAAPGGEMTHLAVQQADESGVSTRWEQPVTDAEYGPAGVE